VKVWGTDRNGLNFCQMAHALEISQHDALLDGIQRPVESGTIVGVQYKENKARARIVWILETSGNRNLKIRIRLLDPAVCPWSSVLSSIDGREFPARERRRSIRHKIPVALELRPERNGCPLHARASDISTGGCYVETLLPLAVGTKLTIGIWLGSDKLLAEGLVRTCDPAVGMGIEFAGLTPEGAQRLGEFLQSSCVPEGLPGQQHNPQSRAEEEEKSVYHPAIEPD